LEKRTGNLIKKFLNTSLKGRGNREKPAMEGGAIIDVRSVLVGIRRLISEEGRGSLLFPCDRKRKPLLPAGFLARFRKGILQPFR